MKKKSNYFVTISPLRTPTYTQQVNALEYGVTVMDTYTADFIGSHVDYFFKKRGIKQMYSQNRHFQQFGVPKPYTNGSNGHMGLVSSALANDNGINVINAIDEHKANGKETKKFRALHIEDDDEIRFLVKAFLKNYIEVDPAVDGDDAINCTSTTKYDLIITDINLGYGIDGIEATREIRNINYYQNVPIIAATANGTSEIRNRCMEVGMDAFLLKPFMKRDLINAIEQVMENRKC